MERKEIEIKLKDILIMKLSVDVDIIKDDSNIIEDLGADSLDVIEIIIACEDEFNISIPDEDVENLLTFKELVNYGEKRLNG